MIYREAHILLEEIAEAFIDETRKEHMELLATVPLLIIDDLGMRRLGPTAAGEGLLGIMMCHRERWPGRKAIAMGVGLIAYEDHQPYVGARYEQAFYQKTLGRNHTPSSHWKLTSQHCSPSSSSGAKSVGARYATMRSKPSTGGGRLEQILLNHAGWKARKPPAKGEVFFLTFPFIELTGSWRQPISVLKCSCNIIPSRIWRNLFG